MYTLKEYLSLEQLKDAEFLTEPEGFLEREINYISVIEFPVEDFVREGELVLSTALGCVDDDEKFLEFIKDIFACNPTALMLSFKPKTKLVPKCIIDFAKQNNFTIIRIPWNCRFSELIELALEGIKDNDRKDLLQYESLQKKLLYSFLSEQSLDAAAEIISSSFCSSVYILNSFQQICAFKNINGDPSKLNEDILREQDMYSCSVEIRVNGRLYGFIEIFGSDKLKINQRLLEDYLSVPLSLWFNKENVINVTGMRIKNDFIWKLANSGNENIEALILDGQKLGFDLQPPYIAIVFRAFSRSQNMDSQVFSPKFISNMMSIENLILSEGNSQNINIMTTIREETFIIYLEMKCADYGKRVNFFIDKLESALLNSYPEYEFYWGIGEIPPVPMDFSQQYKKAMLALEQCINSGSSEHRLTFKEGCISSIIYQAAEKEIIKDQAYQTLNKILEADNNFGANLLLTLTTFLKCNYNASQTARELHLHRQSLLYRLEKIEELTGFSLSKHDDLFLLEFFARLISKF